MNLLTVAAEVGSLLEVELDGGRVYLDDAGNLFALPEDAAIRESPGSATASAMSPRGMNPSRLRGIGLFSHALRDESAESRAYSQ